MVASNYDACLKFTLRQEGGYTNHPSDPGCPTNWGITIHVARLYWKKGATAADVKAMPLSVAKEIYRARYWNLIGGDNLEYGLDLSTFDAAVNSGVGRGPKWLAQARKGGGDLKTIIKRMAQIRRSFLQGLKTFRVFGKGWMRRVNELEALALSMALMAQGATVPQVKKKLRDEANGSKKASGASTGAATGAGGIGGSGTVIQAPTNAEWALNDILIVGALGLIVLLVVGYFTYQAYTHYVRAKAFNEVSDGLVQEVVGVDKGEAPSA
jgi:lysozyme family protein